VINLASRRALNRAEILRRALPKPRPAATMNAIFPAKIPAL
jgi:hypothetical protein